MNQHLDSQTPDERKDQPEGTTTTDEATCRRCGEPYEDHSCYLAPCAGCKGGHSSFWRTITRSPEWKAWEKEHVRRMRTKKREGIYDFYECHEYGWISEGHWREFVKFIKTL